MAAGPSNTDITDLPAAGAEQDDDADSDKPAGWFEAQQNAEAAKRDEDKSDDENPEMSSWFQNALLLVAAGYLLAGCDELTRFTQERYECGNNPNGLVEIDFREFKKGSEASNFHR